MTRETQATPVPVQWDVAGPQLLEALVELALWQAANGVTLNVRTRAALAAAGAEVASVAYDRIANRILEQARQPARPVKS